MLYGCNNGVFKCLVNNGTTEEALKVKEWDPNNS